MHLQDLHIEENRLKTFTDWNVPYIKKETLAFCGFYFLSKPDIVKCHFCKIEIGRWEDGDDVLSDHRKWSPSCKLICGQMTDNIPLNSFHEVALPGVYCKRTVSEGCIDFSSDNDKCKVCLENTVNCAIVSCGHVTCSGCIVMLDKCPICRNKFSHEEIIKIYFA